MKKHIFRPCPVCGNTDAGSVIFKGHVKDLMRLHCEQCNCAFFNRIIPKKPKYDWKYNQAFFKDSEINKAAVMSTIIIQHARRIGKEATVFEIGVGNGLFLKRVQNAGIPCEGVDIDPELCDYLKTKEYLTVYSGGLEKLRLNKQFDIVYSSDVIEHFENPGRFMDQARKLILPYGLLFLNTPDLDCSNNCDPLWHHFKTRAPWEHACVLSPKAMITLAYKRGMAIVAINRTPAFGSFQTLMRKR